MLDTARLRPGYNASAAAASLLAAPWWSGILTASTSTGPWAPLGLTTAALIATSAANITMPCWPARALQFAPITAIVASPAAAHAVLAITTGAQL